jgi:hypothetical protein
MLLRSHFMQVSVQQKDSGAPDTGILREAWVLSRFL